MSPADCTAFAPEPFLVGEPHAMTPPIAGWPEAVSAGRPDLAAMLQELEASATAYGAAQKDWDTIPGPEDGSPVDVAYNEAMTRHCDAIRVWLNFEPTSQGELVAKAQALLSPATGGQPESVRNPSAGGRASEFEVLCRQIVDVLDVPKVNPVQARWDAATQRLADTLAAAQASDKERLRIEALAQARYPEPPADICLPAARESHPMFSGILDTAEYRSALKILPSSIVARLRDSIDTYWQARAEIEAELGQDTIADENDCLWDLHRDAEKALMRTPAPDVAALLTKFRMSEELRSDADFEDEASVQAFLTSDCMSEWSVVEIFRDLVRLSGCDSVAMRATPFDAKAWVDGIEARAFYVGHHGEIFWHPPERSIGDGPTPEAAMQRLFDDLKPYQRRAVVQEAKSRPDPHIPTSMLCSIRLGRYTSSEEREFALVSVADRYKPSAAQLARVVEDLDRFGWGLPAAKAA